MADAYSTRLDDALLFTAQAFRGKIRKGTKVPYLTHLLAVAALVGEGKGDEDLIIAALLHDWLEDIPGAEMSALAQRFGPRVAQLVEACSDCQGHPKPPWKERKDKYLAHLRTAASEVKLISAADKLHNCRSIVTDLQTIGPDIFNRFNAGKSGTLWYYQQVVVALKHDGWHHWLLDRLEAEVAEMLRLSEAA
jgi:(p)ppGpp synthase/HD superfamily hydrolase